MSDWTIVEREAGTWIEAGPNDPIAILPRPVATLDRARLIALAPDLLHFVKWAAQLCEGPFPLTPEQVVQYLPARAHELIAEAEGR